MAAPRLTIALVDPADVADADRFRPLLSPEEQARLDRMRHPRRRHEYLLGRALIRTLLTRAAGVGGTVGAGGATGAAGRIISPSTGAASSGRGPGPEAPVGAGAPAPGPTPQPAEWRFVLGEKGRPELASGLTDLDLRFNLAHTFGLVACVVAVGLEVGLDVEDTWRRGRTTEIADRFFAPAEVAELRSLPEAEQRARFFDYWCLKESYIKARGLGLAIPLRSFAFEVAGPGPIGISMTEAAGDAPGGWHFELASPTSRHRLAVAWRGGAPGAADAGGEAASAGGAGGAEIPTTPELEWLDPSELAGA